MLSMVSDDEEPDDKLENPLPLAQIPAAAALKSRDIPSMASSSAQPPA